MRYLPLLVLVLIAGCSGRPSWGDSCTGHHYSCGGIGTDNRLMLLCDGAAYQSIGTCRGPCEDEAGDIDSLLCDGMRHAEKNTDCNGDTGWSCEAGGGSVLRCLNGRWVTEQICSGDTESCVSNEDGKLRIKNDGEAERVPTLRCANF